MKRKKHILLVDDEVEFLFSAGMALRIAGYLVSVADKVGEALDRVRLSEESGCAVDLLVTDIQMEGMGGKELIGKVSERWPALPMFVMTGSFDRNLEADLAAHRCVGHIRKPFDPGEFLERIGEILDGEACVTRPA